MTDRSIGGGASANAPFTAAPLVGRDDEVRLLREVIDELVQGVGRPVLLEGEAGIGKTRLLEEAQTYTDHLGLVTVSAAAQEYEQQRPFAPLLHALDLHGESPDPRRASLRRLLDTRIATHPLAQISVHHQLVEGLVELLTDVLAPGVLLVEDLHWADAASLLVLQRVIDAEAGVVVVATRRLHPASSEVRRFAEAVQLRGHAVQLAPLDTAATMTLASLTLGRAPEAELAAHLEQTGGNPLFVTVLLAAVRDSAATGWGAGAPLPPTLRAAVLRRLTALADDTAELVRLAAVLGSSFAVADLAAVLDEEPFALVARLRGAVDAGLLLDDGAQLRFRHDLVREAVYDDVPHAIRDALHLQIGRRLAVAGAPSSVVATHWSLGARPGDEEAVAWLRRSAADAAPRDPSTAAVLLERALRLCPLQAPYRDRLATELIASLVWSGRFDDAESWAGKVLQRPHDPQIGGEVGFFLGRIQIYRGQIAESITTVQRALDETSLPAALRARLAADLALRHGADGNIAELLRRADEGLETGVSAADELSISTAHSAFAWGAAMTGRSAVAVESAQRGLATAAEGETVQPVQARLYLGFALVCADRLDEAHETLAAVRAIAAQLGAAWGETVATAFLCWERYTSGCWDEAVAVAEESLALADRTGVVLWAPVAGWVAAAVAVHRGNLRRGEELIARSWAQMEAGNGVRIAEPAVVAVRALVAQGSGDGETAARRWDSAWDRAVALDLRAEALDLSLGAAAQAHRRDDRARGEQIAAFAAEAAAVAATPSAIAIDAMCSALLRDGTALALEAAELARASPRPLVRAEIFEQALGLLAASDERGPRAQLADDALAAYEELGASWDIARVDATRRQLGLRRSRAAAPRSRERFGWEALTNSERRVVELAADGLSNVDIAQRLFVSRRTVETHISHGLAKLGLKSRVEIAALVTNRRHADGEKSP